MAIVGGVMAAEYLGSELLGELNPIFFDATASSVIQMATYDRFSDEITLHLHSGKSYVYPCSSGEWLRYLSAPSKGAFFNEHFKG